MANQTSYTFPPTYQLIINQLLPKGKLQVLDLGCGVGAAGATLNKDRTKEFVGVDIYQPYLDICRKGGFYKKLIKKDLTKINFLKKSFDVVLLFQVIEHLDKKEAIKLIERALSIAKKAVLISVPNGHCHQEAYDGNKYHEHKSEWSGQDLQKLGFRVFGQGLKMIYGSESYEGRKEAKLWQKIAVPISTILLPFVIIFPQIAVQLIAVKNLQKSNE